MPSPTAFKITALDTPVNRMSLVFLVSGFAALIYQVVWQRVLYATFGTNIESVTVIVSVFMFGLGIGSLVGGWLQNQFAAHSLKLFMAIELAIGLFGLCSIPLIHDVGLNNTQNSLCALIETTYMLLSFPTMLMGATLPILVGWLQRNTGGLAGGAVVGKLYAYNTFGSALAALLTVTVLFVLSGEQATIIVAALCNGLTAFFAWRLSRYMRSQPQQATQSDENVSSAPGFSFTMSLMLAATVGFVSLSAEIFWFRIIGWMTAGAPRLFGLLLALFLAGIAFGALQAREISLKGRNIYAFVWDALLKMAAVMYFSVPLIGFISSHLGKPVGMFSGLLTMGVVGYYSGSIFPLLCEGSDKKAEKTIVWVYFFNIVGSTAGSLVTGFVLLDILPLGQALVASCAVLLVPMLALALSKGWAGKPPAGRLYGAIAMIAGVFLLQPVLYQNIIDHLVLQAGKTFRYIKENRNGIIGVFADPDGDVVVGGGIYDGRFNIDPVRNSNLIRRAYMVAGLQRHTKDVLEIGLSSGSWARVLMDYKQVEHMTNVEINPGYVDLIKKYPLVTPVLSDPKGTLYDDDGRRWLKHHPAAKFDTIVMNTSYYWRSNATNVLSKEFLELCKAHLKPGGMIYYNTTGAMDNIFTAAHVFNHVALINNFLAASDTPFDLTDAEKRKNLLQFAGDDGKPFFLSSPALKKTLEQLIAMPIEDLHDAMLPRKDLWLITDDNMAVEFKQMTTFTWPHR